MYHRKAYGPHRSRCRQALAADIAASIRAAAQRGEYRPITWYTHQAETIQLVEKELMATARERTYVCTRNGSDYSNDEAGAKERMSSTRLTDQKRVGRKPFR